MIICQIDDLDLITDTMKLPYIWPYIHDDATDIDGLAVPPPREGYLYYLGVFNPGYCGFFLVARQNKITYEIHTVLTKNCRAKLAIQAAKLVIDWIFENTDCERLVTQIPESNRLAERLAENAGMTRYGINPHSFMLNNKTESQILYGITKELKLCQQ